MYLKCEEEKKNSNFPYCKRFQYPSRYKFREKEKRIFFRDMCVEYMANPCLDDIHIDVHYKCE